MRSTAVVVAGLVLAVLVQCGGGGGGGGPSTPTEPPGSTTPVSQPSCSPTAVKADAIYDISTPYGCEIVIDVAVENGRCNSVTVDRLLLERKYIGIKNQTYNCGFLYNVEVEVGEELEPKASATYRLYRKGYCALPSFVGGQNCEYRYTSSVETSVGTLKAGSRTAYHEGVSCRGKRCYQ